MKTIIYKAVVHAPAIPVLEEVFFDGSKQSLLEGLQSDHLKDVVKAVKYLHLGANMFVIVNGAEIGQIDTTWYEFYSAKARKARKGNAKRRLKLCA